ncbi:MAG: SulP family inorganic anion transporter, partial [Bacteroidota bacterium]
PAYRWKFFKSDFLAGLTVAVVLVPQGMAYALLAGLPPIYGLYASIFPLFLYAFSGTSPQLSVGPTALVSLLLLSQLSLIAEPGSPEYLDLAFKTAVVTGLLQIILGVSRMGFLSNFLSSPVMSGFTSAAACIIALSQFKYLMGVEFAQGGAVREIILGLWVHLGEINLYSLGLGLGGILLIWALRKANPSIPGALITVVLGIGFVYYFALQDWAQVIIIRDVPEGLPSFMLLDLNLGDYYRVLPLSITLCFVSFIESLAIAKSIEHQTKNHDVNPSQELLALGLTKIGGVFFQSFPTTGSFSRSAINYSSGAISPISSMITALLIALTLAYFTPYFYYLPKALLASIVIISVLGLINWKEAEQIWKSDQLDFLVLVCTFICTLFLGIQEGIGLGIGLSFFMVLYRLSRAPLNSIALDDKVSPGKVDWNQANFDQDI